MSNINDKATVSLFVNGEQAEAAMKRLRDKAEELDKQLKAAMAAGDKKSANKLQRELDRVTKELNKTESAAKGTGIVLDNLANSSLFGLRGALKHLQRELEATKPNTEAWHRYAAQIDDVKARINELNEDLEGGQSAWEKFKGWAMNSWPAIDLLSRGYDSVVNGMRQYVDAYASMDQEMANVRKFTGMTEEQVAELNEEFKKIDTRTSREDLNKLAQEAGRLGKTSTEDVLGFVRAADQINVALNDLGEGATLTLSKLTGIFGDEAKYGTEQSLLKVGSVINELSQNCSASAPYLAQFAQRMGGVGAQAKMTIPQIMGFAAVLDSNAQAVEASSTALSQVIVRMMQDPAKYAQVAGLEVEKFTKLLKEDTNSALILFLDTLQKAGGMDALSPMFKDMGENGSRAIAALSTLATHIDQVKAQQLVANEAFEEGTSVTKEFDVQNNTVQAGLDKAKNRFHELAVELGEKLAPLMTHVISLTSAMALKALSAMVDFFIKYRKEIAAGVIAIAAYNVIMLVYNTRTVMATKATALFHGALRLVRGIVPALRLLFTPLINAVQYFTNGLQVNYAMQERWRKSMAAMKFSNWVGLILALGAAIYALANRVKTAREEAEKARKEQEEYARSLTDLDEKSSEYCHKEVSRLEALYKAATDEAKSTDERRRAAERLQALYPDYFKNLSTEQIMVGQAKTAYDQLRDSIIEVARARAAADKIVENEKELLTLEQQEPGLRQKRDADKRVYDAAVADWDRARQMESNQSYSNSTDAAVGQMVDVAPYARRVASTGEVYNASEAAYQANITKQRQLNEANEYLRGKYNISAEGLADPDTPEINLPGNTPLAHSSSNSAPVDRFAKEKAWKEEQEALNRIAYAKGEVDYEDYTARMTQISIDYNQKLLDREDVSGNERLKIQADYWEAVNKQNKEEYSLAVADADESYARDLRTLNENYTARLEAGNLSAEEREALEKSHTEALEMLELEHLQDLLAITAEGTEERAKIEQQYLDARLKAAKRHQQEYEKTQAEHEKLLASLKKEHFGMNQGEKDAEFKKQFAALTEVYNQELAAAAGNEAEILRIKEAYMAAELALRKKYNQEGADDSQSTYSKAIDASVEWLNGDGGKALTGTLSTLTSGMSSIFSGLSSVIQAELDIQTAKIERRYEREIELAQGNSYKVAKLEKQKEKDIAKAKNDANRKMFAMQVIQAVAQTATNALNAYGSAAAIPVVGHVLAPIAAAMAVAAGMIQVASIKKQQQASEAQGYSKGGFTKPGAVDEPAGIVHAGEWVASQKLLANPVARPMIEALDRAQRTNTIGLLKPEDVSRSIRANDSLSRIAEDDNRGALMVAAFARNSQAVGALVERLNEPFVTINTVTGPHGINQVQEDYSRLMNNVTPKSKRKKWSLS